MKLCVYIDGFNLYYGCLKNTPYRWLNLSRLCTLLFPNDEIIKIKYFTAPIKIRENDSDHDRPNRQQIYLRALRTLPNIEIIEGMFLSHNVSMKLTNGRGYATVIKSEEKGTDVNIATHLVHDAHNDMYESAVVVSNDSDLVTPIRVVTNEIRLPVTVISPYNRNNIQLKTVATNIKRIRNGVLGASQFEENLLDTKGEFSIPQRWKLQKTSSMYSQQNIFQKIQSLGLPLGKYIAVGGSSLAARGIRETKDIDIVVTPAFFEELVSQNPAALDREYESKWNRRRIKRGDAEIYPDLLLENKNIFLDVAELIADADLIDGVPFQKLEHLVMCKLDTAREKDLKDVELVKQYSTKLAK